MIWLLIVPLVLTDRVDMVEVNHFYGTGGELVLDQVVWWDWNAAAGRYDVVDWRLIKDCRATNDEAKRAWDAEHPDGPPYVPVFIGGGSSPSKSRGEWVSDWYDEKNGKRRRVTAKLFRESWTHWDVELAARDDLPQHLRRGLKR